MAAAGEGPPPFLGIHMKSIFEPEVRHELLDRIAQLSPERPARWGRLDAPRMVTHLIESARMAAGELPVVPRRLPLRFYPLNHLVVYYAPFPKGAPTVPELLARRPATWTDDVATLRGLIEQVAARDPEGDWPEHPAFGRLSGKGWGVLIYRHFNHHLTQFGV